MSPACRPISSPTARRAAAPGVRGPCGWGSASSSWADRTPWVSVPAWASEKESAWASAWGWRWSGWGSRSSASASASASGWGCGAAAGAWAADRPGRPEAPARDGSSASRVWVTASRWDSRSCGWRSGSDCRSIPTARSRAATNCSGTGRVGAPGPLDRAATEPTRPARSWPDPGPAGPGPGPGAAMSQRPRRRRGLVGQAVQRPSQRASFLLDKVAFPSVWWRSALGRFGRRHPASGADEPTG